ncbi:MAG: type I restriction-modification system subunit M N-terminal domain-containing protein [Methylibium sp.]
MAKNFTELANFIWQVADLLRGDYKQSDYGKVILPFTLLRRLDCVLEATKGDVLKEHEKRKAEGVNLDTFLKRKSKQSFYNTSPFTVQGLLDDPSNILKNLSAYVADFSDDARDVFERFKFTAQIADLDDKNLLYLITQKFASVDLHPDTVPNETMGLVFEELIRKFAELSNETAGEHFTPREVVKLIVQCLFSGDDEALTKPGVVRSFYDPTAGTGGLLSAGQAEAVRINKSAKIVLFGQELNPESYAICKADTYLRRILGNMVQVDTEEELEANQRALTRDCMLSANGGTKRIRELPMGEWVLGVQVPALEDVLDCWRRGVAARTTKPSDVSDWLDAIRVVEHCETLRGQDVPVRRASAKLFGDSKRIQGLSALVDVLRQGSVSSPTRDEEEVLQELGLVRFPPTWMLSANAEVVCAAGSVQVLAPYVGLAPTAVRVFKGLEGTGCLLTVENLTTFHEAAQRRAERPGIAVLYTGGMPSPSWRRVYALLLQALPTSATVLHWGDVDAGGFRIAGHLAALCETAGRRLELHSMSGAAARPEDGLARGSLGAGELSQIRRVCERWNWKQSAADVESNGLAVEQESMPFSWPI